MIPLTHPSRVFLLSLCSLGSCLIALSSASAATLVYEGFDAPPGELDGAVGASSFGWQEGNIFDPRTWDAYDPVADEYYHGISATGLTWPDMPSVEGSLEFRHEAQQGRFVAQRALASYYSYSNSGKKWFSALLQANIDGDPSGGGHFQVALSSSQNEIYMGVSNGADRTLWSAGGERLYEEGTYTISNGRPSSGNKFGLSAEPVISGETAFLVLELDFDEKMARFYVNPDATAEDPGEPAVEFIMLSDLYVDKVMVWGANAGPAVEGAGADYTGSLVDEIRIGDTWADVAAGAQMTPPSGGGDTTPPVITGPSGAAGDAAIEVSLEESADNALVGAFTADESVAWSVSGGADAELFSIGATTGNLSFKEAPDFETPTDADGDNVYEVTVEATDTASNSAEQSVTITITDGDEVGPGPLSIFPLAGDDRSVNSGGWLGWLDVAEFPWVYSWDLAEGNLYPWVYVHPDEPIRNTGSGRGGWIWRSWTGLLEGGVPEGSEAGPGVFANLPISTTPDVLSTGAWYGWLYVGAYPWVYSYHYEDRDGFPKWFYIDAQAGTSQGVWIFRPLPAE